nr:sn-glycerol-1-phosphate dehydrogenase [Paenibacillus oenotherae]
MHCSIGQGVLLQLPDYLTQVQCRNVLIVCDSNTWHAAGQKVARMLQQAGLSHQVCSVAPDALGDVIADEQSIVEIMLETTSETDCILAVGPGTIHDLVRFVCAKLHKRFISVPTAASVDGFTSAGAPLIIRGTKKTIQTTSPAAMFADTDVMMQAPKSLTAAGFGDMLGKYTSLADWKFSRETANEPFCPVVYELTQEALACCVEAIDEIACGTEAGIRKLFEALTISGFAMLLADHSRSASGAEHHLSHYWEMDGIRNGKKQLLHGAKVGVAAIIIARLYRGLAEDDRFPYGAIFRDIPQPEQLAALLHAVGAPTTPEELGIGSSLVERSLKEAFLLRERSTGLRWINMNNGWDFLNRN